MALDHTPAKVIPCKRCWSDTYQGMIEGFKVTAHSVPLSLAGQIAMLKQKRWLYEIQLPKFGRSKMEMLLYSGARLQAGRDAIVTTDHSCEPMPADYIDPIGRELLHQFHHPDPPPALFEPPF